MINETSKGIITLNLAKSNAFTPDCAEFDVCRCVEVAAFSA